MKQRQLYDKVIKPRIFTILPFTESACQSLPGTLHPAPEGLRRLYAQPIYKRGPNCSQKQSSINVSVNPHLHQHLGSANLAGTMVCFLTLIIKKL